MRQRKFELPASFASGVRQDLFKAKFMSEVFLPSAFYMSSMVLLLCGGSFIVWALRCGVLLCRE